MDGISLILGFFDGVHKGHREVIRSAQANKKILVTFKDSPAGYFGGNTEYIYPREKSYEIIKSLGVNEIVEHDFATLADISAEDYLENYLIKKYAPVSISTGFNHTFGAGRKGNADFLTQAQSKYNYKYYCTPKCTIEGEVVSSTRIRELIRQGEITKANNFLGSNFSIKSTVISGAKLGRELGFPTANMIYPQNIVKLPHGVYGIRALNRPAILNGGIKPTVNGNDEILEVHIPKFKADLYK